MSSKGLVEGLAQRIDRRNAVVKVGMGVVGGLAALMGVPRDAAAGTVQSGCCNLCVSPTACTGCTCVWCWYCCESDGSAVQCCECYKSGGSCKGDCGNVKSSCVRSTRDRCWRSTAT